VKVKPDTANRVEQWSERSKGEKRRHQNDTVIGAFIPLLHFFLFPMTVNQLGVRSGVCLTITSDALLDLRLRRRDSLSFQVCAPVGLDVTKLQIC